MIHDEIEELLGAYALHATDAGERAEIEAHLADCPRCRAEVEGHEEMAAMFASPSTEAPPGLWEKIARSIAEDRSHAAPPDPVLGGGVVAFRPRPRRGWRDAGVIALAAVAAAALAFLGVEVAHLRSQVGALQQAQGPSAFLHEPHDTVAMVSTGHVVGRVFLTRTGQAIWYQSSLGKLPPSRTYQLWGLSRGQAVSLGLLGPDPATLASFGVERTTSKIMVTAEPQGGTAQPTTPVLAVGLVPSGYVG